LFIQACKQLWQELDLQRSEAKVGQLQQEACLQRESSETSIAQLQQELFKQRERSQAKVVHFGKEQYLERERYEGRVKELSEELQTAQKQVGIPIFKLIISCCIT
jgi:hypothetical protein